MFEKLFKKKPKDKAIIKFWQEFESRADLYADILAQDAEVFDTLCRDLSPQQRAQLVELADLLVKGIDLA